MGSIPTTPLMDDETFYSIVIIIGVLIVWVWTMALAFLILRFAT